MRLKQLSLFLENKPGNLRKACRTLADIGINIEMMTLAETEQYGILRFLVKDWERAKDVLEHDDFIVRVSEVVALTVGHRPGGLINILDALDDAGQNIEYMYSVFRHIKHEKPNSDSATIVFRFDDPDAACNVLQKRDIHVLGSEELFG